MKERGPERRILTGYFAAPVVADVDAVKRGRKRKRKWQWWGKVDP